VRVLIVGAGIAGLALARSLHDRGIESDVVERTPEWPSHGAGLYLPANAVRALEQLGAGPALAEHANPIERQRFLDHRGRPLMDIDVGRFWNGVGRCVAIRRSTLHETLRQVTSDVPVRLGVAMTGIEVGARPAVTFSDGGSRSYDLVVGADGVHSAVRSLGLGGPAASSVGQASWRFVAHGVPEIADWTVMLGRGRAFLTVALGRGEVYCYADVGATDRAALDGDDWRRAFSGFAEPVASLLDQAADAYSAPIEEVQPPAWTATGTALVGDAAHASSPNMAQGVAMAVEDALVLAELLGAEQPIDVALAEYERRRNPRVAWVQAQTHRRDRARNLPPLVRNLTLRLAGERIFRSNYEPLREEP
jgi:2-polyprenyl-6-methoxyphenol hydroxylase-like FAD-dependent oxidoreductase